MHLILNTPQQVAWNLTAHFIPRNTHTHSYNNNVQNQHKSIRKYNLSIKVYNKWTREYVKGKLSKLINVKRIPNRNMSEGGKKISFGFAKSIKKPILTKNLSSQNNKKIDYVECIDEKAIKIIGEKETKDEPLIIPLLGTKTWHDRIINKVDADIFESKKSTAAESLLKLDIKAEPGVGESNGDRTPLVVDVKSEPLDNSIEIPTSLEEQAAREIINDLKSESEPQAPNTLSLPISEEESLRGKEESTLADYEQIPIDVFGIAMLRGMGWQPGKGIGKNEKIAPVALPELRPKGMGLGADKVTLQKQKSTNQSSKVEEELTLRKGSYIKLLAGKHIDSYGEIQGFDEDSGRLIIKLSLGGSIISVNEFMVQAVSKSEYSKNSKVLNVKKYEEYKNRDASIKNEDLSDSEKEERVRKSRTKERRKEEKQRERYKLKQNDNKEEDKIRKRTSSHSSNSDCEAKRTKKSKKYKRQHDSSPEHSNKKSKNKKDKERDREKKKHKKHKRSRSRT